MRLQKFAPLVSSLLLLFLPIIALADSTTVVLSFPSPGPSPQDLAWDGNYLWCADDSTDSLYKLDPADGTVILSFPTPGPEPRGLTWDGNYLWCSDNDSVRIFKLDPSDGSAIFSIPAPFEAIPDIHGLAWDGQYLWSGYFAGYSTSIVKVDPEDGSILGGGFIYGVPMGLASDGTYLWYTADRDGRGLGIIYRYRIHDNDLWWVSTFDIPVYFPTGLAWEDGHLWLADTDVDSIYKLKLIPTAVELPRESLPPRSFMLLQNYPNPFNSETIIKYRLPVDCEVSIEIFDIGGRVVKTLLTDRKENAGTHESHWNGRDNYNRSVPSGVYLCQIRTKEFNKTIKMILVR